MSEQIVKIYASQDWVIENTVKSWNDLEDKPFGEIIDLNEVNATYASGTITTEDGSTTISGSNVSTFLEQEASYYVEWDGVLYQAQYNSGVYGIGNMHLMYEEEYADTGEPFLICQGVSSRYLEILSKEDGGHTYKIYTGSVSAKTLDEKYIPDTIARVEDLDIVAANKADKVHNHDDIYYTETEIDTKLDGKVPISRTINGKSLSSNITLTAADVGACGLPEFESMELITIDDIDAICGAPIQAASAEGVKF